MTTTTKAQGTSSRHSGAPREHPNGRSRHTHHTSLSPFGEAARILKALPARVQNGLHERPEATLAAVAAGSFVLGAVLGSRIVRAAVYAAIPYLATQLIQGDLGDALRSYVSGVLPESPAQ
jgi:hypothetical protein